MQQESCSQAVHAVTNVVMPGLVKLGKTAQSEVGDRMRQIGTGLSMTTGASDSVDANLDHQQP
jgi:hypothetical protein